MSIFNIRLVKSAFFSKKPIDSTDKFNFDILNYKNKNNKNFTNNLNFLRFNNTKKYTRENFDLNNRTKKLPVFKEKIFVTDRDFDKNGKLLIPNLKTYPLNNRHFENNLYYNYNKDNYKNFNYQNDYLNSLPQFNYQKTNQLWLEINDYYQGNKTDIFKANINNADKYGDSREKLIKNNLKSNKKILQNRDNKTKIEKSILSSSDPIKLIHEKENFVLNMRWSPDLINKFSFGIPDKIINFEYEDEYEDDLDGFNIQEKELFKEFVKMASDFSFLSGSTLTSAVCMYKAVLPLMLLRWKHVNGITISRLDSIIKIMLGVPFFKYFEDKENMINTCINTFFISDVNINEGLGLKDPKFENSILGISITDFKVYQYYRNKKKFSIKKKNENDEDPNDSANLLETIYDDICNYFYECIDQDLHEDVDEYVFQNAMIFDVTENKPIKIFKQNSAPLFPDTSERKSSVDSLPSDKFIASLQEIMHANFELPELNYPGLNIRDLGRLYYYAGRIGLILPIRLMLKMIYEMSYFANYSTLLRQAYCTETLIKLTNFKLADVICNVAFSSIPLLFNASKLFIKLEDIIKRVSNSPSKWKFRPNPVFSKAELNSLQKPEILSVPEFIELNIIQDIWMLYRSLSIQLYGSVSVTNDENISSIISMIHSMILGYIKLFWEEFKSLYIKTGILDPESYYSLLLNQRRSPSLIELIAFARIYQIPIKIYTKFIENSKEKIEFHLDKELTELIENLSQVKYSYDENFEKNWKGNTHKFIPCKVIRLLVNKKTTPNYNKEVFSQDIDMIIKDNKLIKNIDDGSNWTWNTILPIYDKETNEKILSQNSGVKIEYKTINTDYINFLNNLNNKPDKDIFFPEIENISNRQYNNNWRNFSKHKYGKILINKIQDNNLIKTSISDNILNDKKEFSKQNFSDKNSEENLTQYFIVVQPLILYLEVGVYESRMFMNKIFKDFPLYNWDKLPKVMNIEFLQSIIYVGDLNNTREKIDLKNWKPSKIDDLLFKNNTESLKNLNKTFESEKFINLKLDSEIFNSTEELDPKYMLESKLESDTIELDKINSKIETEVIQFKIRNKDSELKTLVIPTKKPWNNEVNLLKLNLYEDEPPFSFIPLKKNIPIYKKEQLKFNQININNNLLFSLAKNFWMLPLETTMKTLFCFTKGVEDHLYNPDPEYIPEVLIYDKIISTVVSLLPVFDKTMNNLRPTSFIITVCEMALVDPIDLGSFLIVNNNKKFQNFGTNTTNESVKLLARISVIKDICLSFTECIQSSKHNTEYQNLNIQSFRSNIFNTHPNSEHIIQIQKLVPKFPEVIIIVRNLLRMIYFVSRRGFSFKKEVFYQLAKELSITIHSISPYIWKSNNFFEKTNNYKANKTFSEKDLENDNSYMPIYEEAYWGTYDRELLLNTCAAILTKRNIFTYPTAIVICHYTFLRIPFSFNGIYTSIPSSKDLEEDVKIATKTTFFYLQNFVDDPIKLIKSKEYNDNPMNNFVNIISEWEKNDLKIWNTDSDIYYRKFFTANYLLDMYVIYEDYVSLIIGKEYDLEDIEVELQNDESRLNNKNINFSETQQDDSETQATFLNNYQHKKNLYKKETEEFNFQSKNRIENNTRFSKFWRYKPNPYKKSFKKSIFGLGIDDIFESISVLLYSTNIYKDLIKSTSLSAISLIKTICKYERDILNNSKNDKAYIHVEGVDQEIVLYVLSICSKIAKSKVNDNDYFSDPENHVYNVELFELLEFIYKIPIMVYEIDMNLNSVKDTKFSNRIYKLRNTNSLIYSLRIAKIYNKKDKSFRYQALIPKVLLANHKELKNGIGPIPYKAMIKTINLIRNKNKDRTYLKFRRRTEFDQANENNLFRKQAFRTFSNECIDNCDSDKSLLPLLRRYIPFTPGDVEGKSLLEFIKMATAVIDLRRRPIKDLPDKNMEDKFRSLLESDKEITYSKDYFFDTYGIDIGELFKQDKSLKFDSKIEDIDQYYDILNTEYKNINPNAYKFITDYFNYVKNMNLSPKIIHTLIETERIKNNSESIKKPPGIKEMISEFIKYSAINIFSEVYYYWNTFKVKFNEFSNNPYQVTLKLTEKEKERASQKKKLKMYIEGKINEIQI